MAAQEPFTVPLEPNPLEYWDDESTASALRALAVRLHSMDISFRETAAALEKFGVIQVGTRRCDSGFTALQRRPQTRRRLRRRRVAVNETEVKIGTEQHWIRRDRCQDETAARRLSQNGVAPIPPDEKHDFL